MAVPILLPYALGNDDVRGELSAIAPAPSAAAAGTVTADGPLAATAPVPVVDVNAVATISATMAASAPTPTVLIAAAIIAAGDLDVAAPAPTFTAAATVRVDGPLLAVAPLPVVDATGGATARGSFAAVAPLPTYGFVVFGEADGLLVAEAPLPTVLLADGGPHEFPTYQVEIDWNSDGDWSDGNEDVTEDVAGPAGVAIQYGRDGAQAFAPSAGGSAGMELDNTSELYTPANQASPLYGLLLPGRPVRMHVTVGPSTYSLFYGRTDDSPLDPDINEQSVQVSMLDGLAELRGQDVSTALYRGIRTGEAIGHILDAAGWPVGLRDIDTGATVLPWWWCAEDDAYDALIALVNSEGPPALLSVGSEGEVVFRDRHHRLLSTASRDVQAYWAARDLAEGSKVALSWSDVVNHVAFEVPERSPDSDISQVWTTENLTTFAAGETQVFRVIAAEPFIDAIVPVEDVDYVVTTGTVSISLNRTSGQRATISVTAGASPATVMGMALRAYSVPTRRTWIIQMEDTTSITKYGRRSWPAEAGFAGVHDARAQAALILDGRADPLPTLTARFVSTNASELAHQVARDLSDRVEVVDHTALGGQWFVDTIAHRFEGRVGHETVFTCEQVRAIDATEERFTLGSAEDGVLGSDKLGRTAAIEVHNVLILGSASNGVIGTNRLGF